VTWNFTAIFNSTYSHPTHTHTHTSLNAYVYYGVEETISYYVKQFSFFVRFSIETKRSIVFIIANCFDY